MSLAPDPPLIDPGKHFALYPGVGHTSITLAATELFERGHFSSVVAVCVDVLYEAPDDLDVRMLLARALVALRQDREAERQLGEILRRDPGSSMAFQLFGEIAYRQDDLTSAEVYFRESWRLDPSNASARIWLDVTLMSNSPGGAAVSGLQDSGQLVLPRPARRRRFAKGTAPALSAYRDSVDRLPVRARAEQTSHDDAPHANRFGGYLVSVGVLSNAQLQLVLAHHREARVRVGDAAVALGYVSRQKLDWAALGFHSRRR